MHKNQKGFGLMESLLITLILAVVGFGGYTVWHNQHTPKQTPPKTTSMTSGSKLSSQANTNSAIQYLEISQLGIKLPLSDNLSGLYYWWDGSQAWILSPSVDQYAAQQDPNNCAAKPSGLTSTNSLGGQDYQEIGLVYKGSAGNQGKLNTITVGDQTYTLHGASSGCSSNKDIVNQVKIYQTYLETSFSKAQTL